MSSTLAPAFAAAHEDAPRDPDSPSGIAFLTIPSHGDRIHALFYRASGAGLHPTLVLLHGFPGFEQNADIAHAARRAGWHVIAPRYRGAWGSPGSFSWQHVLEDAAAVVAWARTAAAESSGIDVGTIAIAGNSLGGFAALMTASEDPEIAGAAAFAAFNFGAYTTALAGDPDAVTRTAAEWEYDASLLNGASGRALAEEAFARRRAWDLRGRADAIVGPDGGRPLLLVAAARDTVAPAALHQGPLAVSLLASGAGSLTATTVDADHSFAEARFTLADLVLEWLGRVSARSAA